MRFIIGFALVGSFILFPSSFQSAVASDCRDTAQTTIEMQACASKLYQQKDHRLNIVYQKLRSLLDSEGKQRLNAAEQDWLKFRDSHCEFDVDIYRGGSIQPQLYTGCLDTLTSERIKQLEDAYHVYKEGM